MSDMATLTLWREPITRDLPGRSWKVRGRSMEGQWKVMEGHGAHHARLAWKVMEGPWKVNGRSWKFMEGHGRSWKVMEPMPRDLPGS